MIDQRPCHGPRIEKCWSRASSQKRLFDVVGAAEEEFWRHSLESRQLTIHPFHSLEPSCEAEGPPWLQWKHWVLAYLGSELQQATAYYITKSIALQFRFPSRHVHIASSFTHLYPSPSLFIYTMAPVRRYLRISKFSVLECRIYLDNPALAQSWLLNPRNPVLPKVIESIRPLVLPKLREERERQKSKTKSKKKGIKDVVVSGISSRSPLLCPSQSANLT